MKFAYALPVEDPEKELRNSVTIDLEGPAADDHIMNEMRKRNTFYEDELLEHIAMRGPQGGIYIDIGANIGNHSVFFGKFVADHVIAIEASPMLVPILKRNLETTAIKNYSLVASGVGAEVGVGRLVLPDVSERNLAKSKVRIVTDPGYVVDGVSILPVTTVDRVLAELQPGLGGKRVTFVKLDVEGMELDALHGAKKLLNDQRPQLAIELATTEEYLAVRSLLAEFGYEDVEQFCHTPTYHFIDPSIHQLRASRYISKAESERHKLHLATLELASLIPECVTSILVDEDKLWTEGVMAGRHHIPFLERDGEYWGPPPDDKTAIREFKRLRQVGATFMVFAWPAFWWLGYYTGLHQHLRSRFRCVLENDRLVVFDLRS